MKAVSVWDWSPSPCLIRFRAEPEFEQPAPGEVLVLEPAVVQRFPVEPGLLNIVGHFAAVRTEGFLIRNFGLIIFQLWGSMGPLFFHDYLRYCRWIWQM